jgi:hypothetical protein
MVIDRESIQKLWTDLKSENTLVVTQIDGNQVAAHLFFATSNQIKGFSLKFHSCEDASTMITLIINRKRRGLDFGINMVPSVSWPMPKPHPSSKPKEKSQPNQAEILENAKVQKKPPFSLGLSAGWRRSWGDLQPDLWDFNLKCRVRWFDHLTSSFSLGGGWHLINSQKQSPKVEGFFLSTTIQVGGILSWPNFDLLGNLGLRIDSHFLWIDQLDTGILQQWLANLELSLGIEWKLPLRLTLEVVFSYSPGVIRSYAGAFGQLMELGGIGGGLRVGTMFDF